jgi:hypothetical protein
MPSLHTGEWTLEEDALLIEKQCQLGCKWVKIARFFPNRTDAMIKNRFNLLLRQSQKQGKLEPRQPPEPDPPWPDPPWSDGFEVLSDHALLDCPDESDE